VIIQLLMDLNKFYCLNLDSNYSPMRCAGASLSGAERGKVALSIPQYVAAPCFSNDTHIENFISDDYEDMLRSGPEEVRAAIEREMTGTNKAFIILNAMANFKGDSLKALTTANSASIWMQDDPVHLTSAAYAELTSNISSIVSLQLPSGRKQIASVVKETAAITGRGKHQGCTRGLARGRWRGRGSRGARSRPRHSPY
jgi:hypothetical protein